jgi:hypothetical protein
MLQCALLIEQGLNVLSYHSLSRPSHRHFSDACSKVQIVLFPLRVCLTFIREALLPLFLPNEHYSNYKVKVPACLDRLDGIAILLYLLL